MMDPVLATYRLDVGASSARRRAEELAREQTVELPEAAVRRSRIRERVIPKTVDLRPGDERGQIAVLAYDAALSAIDAAGLLNLLIGNSSLQPDVELIDVDLPEELRIGFAGPRHGISGLRNLSGIRRGPLTCTALKPLGLGPDELASLAATLARGGIDLIKDDHGLGDHPFCPFDERVRAVTAALERVASETGHRALYAPHVLGGGEALRRQAALAEEAGADAVLCCPMLVGPAAFHELARRLWDRPVIAHPALAGGRAIAPELLAGRLFRLFGADASIYPHLAGRFRWERGRIRRLVAGLRDPWPPLRPALPVPAGGMSLERVPEIVSDLGPDVMLLIGGNLLAAGEDLEVRTRAFVEAARAAGEERDA